MKTLSKRPALFNALCFFYVFLELILPLVSLIYFHFTVLNQFNFPLYITGAQRLMFLFIALPIFVVYGWLVLKEHFPENIKESIYLFLPIFLSWLYSWRISPEESWVELFMFEALPLYLGLNLLFLLGFCILVIKQGTLKRDLQALLVFLILLLFIFAPAGLLFWIGWLWNQDVAVGYRVLTQFEYLALIVLTAWSNYPIMLRLHQQKQL